MKRQDQIILNNKSLVFRAITIDDEEMVMTLFRACEDFYVLTEGKVPDECDDLFHQLPPGKNLQDKHLYGVFEGIHLIAAIDLVEDYPEKGEWIIGLLLIHPTSRGIGLGRKIHDRIRDVAINKGAVKLRIGVLEQNVDGLNFWKKIGYQQTSITEPRTFGTKESRVIVMNDRL